MSLSERETLEMPGPFVSRSSMSSGSTSFSTSRPFLQEQVGDSMTKASRPQNQQRRRCSKKLTSRSRSFVLKHVTLRSRPSCFSFSSR